MIKGRYSVHSVLVPSNMEAKYENDCIRIDDKEHLDFWLELRFETTVQVFADIPIGALVCFADGQLCAKINESSIESVHLKQVIAVPSYCQMIWYKL